MTKLERHCRQLLVSYPRWYRKEREGEILDTLLETAAPDRSWPSSRDTRALIIGGLRVRAGLQQRLTVGASLTQALLLAAVLMLASRSALALDYVRGEWGHTFPSSLFAWVNLVLGLATLAAMVGAWFGPPRVVAVVALVTACIWVYQPLGDRLDQVILLVAAFAFIAVMALRGERLARSWLWLAVPWYVMFVLPYLFPASQALDDVRSFGLPLIVAAAIAWCVVDLRPMLAVALWSALGIGGNVIAYFFFWIFHPTGFSSVQLIIAWPWETIAAMSTVLVVVAIWRLRRQALL